MPAPTAKKRTALTITLAVLGVLVLLGGAAGLVALGPIIREYPSSVDDPAEVAGLTRLHDPELQQIVDQMTEEVKSSVKADSTVAGFYAPAGDRQQLVMLVAGTKLALAPAKELDAALRGVSKGSGTPLSDVRAVPAGPLGGTTRCGSVTLAAAGTAVPVAVCAWADHGSLGLVFFFNRTIEDAEGRFRAVREGVLHRG
ncbi:hypothetical protein ACNTMW_19475 [Planosporangium sp. 12N6]|uniref:hypothetical protein n=1 Tax=Planosporangium spinosum TaxID=3402278 RepID=UPI003CFAB706